jgi:crotonobetainyl-CoA:carnitine CoA-transferase CaiB-like acyl-CoA transferase
MAAAAGRKDWITDPRFAQYLDRRANWGQLMEEFETWSKTHSSATCLGVLESNSVPAAAYRTVREALPTRSSSTAVTCRRSRNAGGTFNALNPPFRMSASSTTVGARAPGLGEHTREVLGG